MSKSIDEKIVEMRFDNRQFETNVQTSLSTLGKLKESLKLKDAAKGLQDVDSAAKKVNFNPLGDGVEAIKVKFSALEVMAVTALANITNSAVNAGKRLMSAFTIDPIKTGFQEYETQINAVQTILANTQSKGTTIDQVNSALDELNHYADKTIYNFTEMTRNIGTFTAAGVDLDTSVNAIQGIANLAATSGSTSQQASTAMYQLSQALAAGTVKLQDWNSVVNAGMGGQVFQDALKETARAHGIAIDQMIEDEGSFRESLQNGWISSDILTETLQHFTEFTEDYNEETLKAQGYTEEQIAKIKQLGITGTEAATKVKTFTQLMDTLKEAAQSGWTQSWEYIIGDFEQAKELWTKVSDYFGDAINKSADARNKVLEGWRDMGGRTDLMNIFTNSFKGLMNIITPIKEAFREIFPPTTAKQLLNMTKSVERLTLEFMKFTGRHKKEVKQTFLGIFSAVDIVISAFKALGKGLISLSSNFGGVISGMFKFASSIGSWLVGLRNGVNETNIFGTAIDKLVGFLQKGIDKFKEFVKPLTEKIHMPTFDDIGSALEKVWGLFEKVGGVVKTVGSSIGKAFSGAFQNGDIKNLIGIFNGGVMASILLNIRKLLGGDGLSGIKSIIETLKDPLGSIKDMLVPVESVLDGVKGCLQSYQEQLKAGSLIKIAVAIGLLAASIWVLSTIDSAKLTASVFALGALFSELVGAMAILAKIDGLGKNTKRAATVMIGMSVAILIMAKAVKTLSDMEPGEMIQGVLGIAALAAILATTASLMSKYTKRFMKGATGLVLMSAAVKILASACKDLGAMNPDELKKGLIGVGALLAEIALFTRISGDPKHMISTGVGVIAIAAAMKILASAMTDFGSMQLDQIGRGLLAMGGSLALIAATMNLLPKGMLTKSIGLIGVSAALLILANALTSFASLKLDEIGRGLLALGGSLGILAIALNLMSGTIGGSISLLAACAALAILAPVLKTLGSLKMDEIGRGLLVLGGSLAILVIALNLMTAAIPGALALIIAAGALAILAPVLKTLGEMSMSEIGKSLLVLAGAFAVIGIAGLLLAPIVPALIGLSAAITLLGVGALACGVGVLALSTGLASLAVSGAAGVSVICYAILELVKLIPNIAVAVGQGIIEIIKIIGESSGTIAETVVSLIAKILQVLAEYMPTINESVYQIFVSMIQGIRDHIGEITEAAIDIVVNFIEAIASKYEDIVQAGWDLIIAMIDGIANGITENEERLKESIINLCKAILIAFCDFFAIESPSKLMAEQGGYIVSGLINGIGDMIESAGAKMKELGSRMLSAIKEKFAEFKEKGSEAISNFKSGMESKAESAKSGMTNIVNKVGDAIKSKYSEFKTKGTETMNKFKSGIDSMKSKLTSGMESIVGSLVGKIKEKWQDFKDAGTHLMEGFKSGIDNLKDKVVGAASTIANNVTSATEKALQIKSPSRVFMRIGRYTDEGFAIGLTRYADGVAKASEGIGQTAIDSIYNAVNKVSDIDGSGLIPTISPVLDTSNIMRSSKVTLGAEMNTLISKPVDSLTQMFNEAQSQITKSNNAVISAIKELRDDMNVYYSSQDKETAIYVDGKKLASTIARPMNQQLSILSKRGAH